jgi:hypothetical protein
VTPAFCCLTCRLLQDATSKCRECTSTNMVSMDNAHDVLAYRDLTVAAAPDGVKGSMKTFAMGASGVVMYAGLIAGSLLWPPALPIAIGSGIGAIAAATWRYQHRRGSVSQVGRWPIQIASGGIEKAGVARRLTETFASIIDGAPALAEQVEVLTRRGVLFRRVRNPDFLVQLDGGNRVVIGGTVRLELPALEHKLERHDARLRELGIPVDLALRGRRLVTARVLEGDRVIVHGRISIENVQQLAFHRDAGETSVLRGRAGAVVLVRAA